MSFAIRKLLAGWALGPGRFLALAAYSLVARLFVWTPPWPADLRDFIAGVVAEGGRITSCGGLADWIRVEQSLDDVKAKFVGFVRPGTSDLEVWTQVVREREYAPTVRAIREFTGVDVRTVLDLGANIGLTTAYFGAVYPEARILAVEPHPGSFQMLKRNTAPLGERVDAFQAAFWVSDEPLGWASDQFRDGRDWSRSVERVTDAEDTVDVVTPAGALGRLGVERVDLAKIDIEGSEAEFFATDEATEALLGLADVFAIELHLEVVDPLRTAMAFERGGFLTIPTGDYVIAIRRSRMVEN